MKNTLKSLFFVVAILFVTVLPADEIKRSTDENLRQDVKARTGHENIPEPTEEELENTGFSNKAQPRPKTLPEKGTAKPAETVLFGVYPVGIYDLDMSKNSFRISFYAWWRTKDLNYHPEKSIEITNASHYYSKFGEFGKNGDEYFTYVHYYATLQHDWNIKYFPFDRQILDIRLEDFADIQTVIFKPDYDQSDIHAELSMKGWKILGLKLKETTTHYTTNFGDISTPKGLYSRITFDIEIKREGWRLFFDYFIGFFIAVFLCLITCFVDLQSIETRSTLILGAIFGFVGNKYILNSALPPTGEFTYVDIIQAITLIVVVLSVFLNIILTSKLLSRFNERSLKLVDSGFAIVAGLVYIFVVSYSTYLAVVS